MMTNIVGNTLEFQRVQALPWRPFPWHEGETVIQLCIKQAGASLRPVQIQALEEVMREGHLLGSIGVGHGKTLICLLAAAVTECRRPVYIFPAAVRKQTELAREAYAKHFNIRADLRLQTAESVSSPKSFAELKDYKPDLVIIDECHMFKNRTAARTKRLLGIVEENNAKLVAVSGTICRRSIRDFWRLAVQALGDKVPLPRGWYEAEQWANALDDNPREYVAPGALRMLLQDRIASNGWDHRVAFSHRFFGSPGILRTEGQSAPMALRIAERSYFNDALEPYLTQLRKEGRLRDRVFADPLQQHAAANQLAHGFFYEQVWPGGKPDFEWLGARTVWALACREICKKGIAGVDTEATIRNAVLWNKYELGNYRRILDAWQAVNKPGRAPKTRPVWVSDLLTHFVSGWLADYPGGIVWAEHDAFLEKCREYELPVFFAGDDSCLGYPGGMVLSQRGHMFGKNFQDLHHKNLVLFPPSAAADWDQILGRTHRQGQQEDEVRCDVLLHTEEAVRSFGAALKNAVCLRDLGTSDSKLLVADFSLTQEHERLIDIVKRPQLGAKTT